MKKTQVALAALALVASTAALADGVTVYGNLEAAIAKTTGVSTQFSGDGGYIAGNNWGLKGSEDLGNGLKANFNLEQGIDLNGNVDNGGNGAMFNRLANVGVSGDFGSVALGQQLSPYIATIAGGTAGNGHFFVNRIIMAGGVHAAGANTDATAGGVYSQGGGFFIRNAVSYSGSFSGVNVSAMTGLKQGSAGAVANAASRDSDQYTAYSIGTTLAGLNIAYAAQDRHNTYKSSVVAASYPIGDITLSGTWMSHKDQGADSVGSISGGVSYALSSSTNVAVQYARNDLANEQSITGLHLQHNLSKRTFLFGSYTRATNGAISNVSNRAAYATSGDSNSTFAAGVVHSF